MFPKKIVDTPFMIKKINFKESQEIYLFTSEAREYSATMLSEFINFLKFNKSSMPYKFSFVGKDPLLMNELTLNQNIMIDFTADSLTENKEVQFEEFLGQKENNHLRELYLQIDTVAKLPLYVDAQINKIASLLSALLKEGEFIFLESPEENLDVKSLSIFIKALKTQIDIKQQNVFIFSKNIELWKHHSQKLVCRSQDFKFITTKIETIHELDHLSPLDITSKIIESEFETHKDIKNSRPSAKTPKIKIA